MLVCVACTAKFSDCLPPSDLAAHLNILSPKQRLPIALAQVKAGSTFENLLKEIHQIIHSLYQAKEVNKKVYNIMNSIKL